MRVDFEQMFEQVKSIQRAAGRLSVELAALEIRERERAYQAAIRSGPAPGAAAAEAEAGMGEDAS